jgi:hypothetical protein
MFAIGRLAAFFSDRIFPLRRASAVQVTGTTRAYDRGVKPALARLAVPLALLAAFLFSE